MTEKEAIEILRNNFPKTCKMVNGRYKGGFDDTECEFGKAFLLSISALEEIQQYRAIGTVEECREAVERKMPQKPKREVLDKDLKIGNVAFKKGTRVYLCPSCGKGITGSDIHCRWCGQAISWENGDAYEQNKN